MKTGTARYAKHYEIAAYGESAVRWGYNHWWGKACPLGFSVDTANSPGRTTESDVTSGWGVVNAIHDVLNSDARADNRCWSGQDVPKKFAPTTFCPFSPKSLPREFLTLDTLTDQRFPPPCSAPTPRVSKFV